jgi:hypothetical protein
MARLTSGATSMSYRTSSSSRGCATCGGGSYHPSAPPPAVYDPCAGGLAPSAVSRERGCGCGCSGGGACSCTKAVARTRTYDSAKCPTFAVSCETKLALRDCAKVALCDLLRCVSETLCPDGEFDLSRFEKHEIAPGGIGDAGGTDAVATPRPSLQTELINCVGQALCTFMHCVPQALCPEPCALPAPVDCLPCDYAVEVVR